MKTLIILLFICASSHGQIIATFNPVKLAPGLLIHVDRLFCSYEQGHYPDMTRTNKIVYGISFNKNHEQCLLAGPAYDSFHNVLSFELGGFVNIGRLSFFISVDPLPTLNKSGKLGIGINFLSKSERRFIKSPHNDSD
jgi:hypothetical protein